MSQTSSISATKILSFLNNLTVYDINLEQVIDFSGVDPFTLSSPDNRVSGFEAKKIIEAAVSLTKNDNLGLHQGEHLSKGFSNILGYILMNCSNLKECWINYCQYEKILDSTSFSNFNLLDNNALLRNVTVDKFLKTNRQFSDFKLAGILSYVKLLTNKNLQLHEVHFTHSKPKDTSEYERIFKCKLNFEKPANALIFDSQLLDIPVIGPNKNLLLMFEKNAQEILEALTDNNMYTNMVSEIILEEIMKYTLPSIEEIAKKLSLSVRNLQLYLQKEDTSYNKLIKKIRKNIAEKYLKDRNIPVDEIAYFLGFSESSAFHRAFKSWTGLTPVQFRLSVLKPISK